MQEKSNTIGSCGQFKMRKEAVLARWRLRRVHALARWATMTEQTRSQGAGQLNKTRHIEKEKARPRAKEVGSLAAFHNTRAAEPRWKTTFHISIRRTNRFQPKLTAPSTRIG